MAERADGGARKGLPVEPPVSLAVSDDLKASAAQAAGFSAHLRGASLADVVQLECLGRLRSTVRVVSGTRTGILYFEQGKIVHAETARARGEEAALEVLSWDGGSIETVVAARDGAAAPVVTISCAPEALLLRAAQARDERGRPNLVALPGRDGGGRQSKGPAADAGAREKDVRKTMGFDSTAGVGGGQNGGGDRARFGDQRATREREAFQEPGLDLPVAVRLGPTGEVLEAVSEELADAVAYAARLGGLIGELMGLDALQAMEFASKSERLVAFVEEGGEMAAVRVPASINVAGLLQRVGL